MLQVEDGDAAAAPVPAAGAANSGGAGDGYRMAKRDTTDAVALLRTELLALLNGARWWEKDTEWLQVRLLKCPPLSATSQPLETLNKAAAGAAEWRAVVGEGHRLLQVR